jgi:AbrB family looped-hinge helix DNA binding protein
MPALLVMVNRDIVVKMDRQGRILIPAAVRKRIGARLFVLEEGEGGELRLKPIKEIRLTDFFRFNRG